MPSQGACCCYVASSPLLIQFILWYRVRTDKDKGGSNHNYLSTAVQTGFLCACVWKRPFLQYTDTIISWLFFKLLSLTIWYKPKVENSGAQTVEWAERLWHPPLISERLFWRQYLVIGLLPYWLFGARHDLIWAKGAELLEPEGSEVRSCQGLPYLVNKMVNFTMLNLLTTTMVEVYVRKKCFLK